MAKTTPAPESGGFAEFVYNKERGEVFGRTGTSWAKIGIFYVFYYIGLAGFFVALLSIFLYSFTDDKAPVLTGAYSVLPPLPGMGYQPMVIAERKLLTYDLRHGKKENETRQDYKEAMDKFLTTGSKHDRVATSLKAVNYYNPDASLYRSEAECTAGATEITRETKPCMFNASSIPGLLENCPMGDYGYDAGTPCVAVKMNRIFEFMPEVDGGGDDILIECKGQYTADEDNAGPITFWPSKGSQGVIKKHFFPFLGQPNYMSPLVFIKFEEIQTNVLVQVMCRPTNLLNVKTDGKELQGKIHFEVYLKNA